MNWAIGAGVRRGTGEESTGHCFDGSYLPSEAVMAGKLVRLVSWLSACLLSIAAVHAASPPLVVHEWGTFTSFQDARGEAIPGINVDDEPVPGFVHRLRDYQTFRT